MLSLRILLTLAILAMQLLFLVTLQAQETEWQWSRLIPEIGKKGEESIKLPLTSGFIQNIRMHPTTTTTQSEMSIAVHPLNPNILIAGSNATGWPTVTYLSQGWYVSTNGGISWTGSDTLPPHLNHPGGLSNYMADPAVGIDRNGVLYFNALLYDGIWKLICTKSTNNGSSWIDFSFVTSTNANDPDKNHLSIDNTTGPYSGYLYTAYTEFVSRPYRVRFSRSTNAGQTWSTPAVISNGSIIDQGVNVQIGINGEVYAVWSNYTSWPSSSNISFNKSTNGGVSWGGVINALTNVADLRGYLVKGGYSIRVSSFPSMAIDHSNSARRGWIYVVYPERVSGAGPDIRLIRSTNGGASWGSPVRVNQDNTTHDQWYPWCAVDPSTGILYVVYYDSRNFPNNDSAQVYVSYSLDGGNTFEDVQVSDAAFLPRPISGLAPGYMGDYIGIAATNGVAYSCWNDNRTGVHQAYIGKIAVVPTSFTNRIGVTNAGGTFTVNGSTVQSGGYTYLLANTLVNARTNNERFEIENDSIYKHHNWNNSSIYYTLNRSFNASFGTEQYQNTYFIGLNPVTLRNELIDAPSQNFGTLQFRDPWYLHSDPNRPQPDSFITYNLSTIGPFTPTGAHDKQTGGVFLNQGDPQFLEPPYYTVRVPQVQMFGRAWFNAHFYHWTATGLTTVTQPNNLESPVIFKSENDTVKAVYKGHRASSTNLALAGNNQRKLVYGKK